MCFLGLLALWRVTVRGSRLTYCRVQLSWPELKPLPAEFSSVPSPKCGGKTHALLNSPQGTLLPYSCCRKLMTRRMSADGTPPSLDVFVVQCLGDKDLVHRLSAEIFYPCVVTTGLAFDPLIGVCFKRSRASFHFLVVCLFSRNQASTPVAAHITADGAPTTVLELASSNIPERARADLSAVKDLLIQLATKVLGTAENFEYPFSGTDVLSCGRYLADIMNAVPGACVPTTEPALATASPLEIFPSIEPLQHDLGSLGHCIIVRNNCGPSERGSRAVPEQLPRQTAGATSLIAVRRHFPRGAARRGAGVANKVPPTGPLQIAELAKCQGGQDIAFVRFTGISGFRLAVPGPSVLARNEVGAGSSLTHSNLRSSGITPSRLFIPQTPRPPPSRNLPSSSVPHRRPSPKNFAKSRVASGVLIPKIFLCPANRRCQSYTGFPGWEAASASVWGGGGSRCPPPPPQSRSTRNGSSRPVRATARNNTHRLGYRPTVIRTWWAWRARGNINIKPHCPLLPPSSLASSPSSHRQDCYHRQETFVPVLCTATPPLLTGPQASPASRVHTVLPFPSPSTLFTALGLVGQQWFALRRIADQSRLLPLPLEDHTRNEAIRNFLLDIETCFLARRKTFNLERQEAARVPIGLSRHAFAHDIRRRCLCNLAVLQLLVMPVSSALARRRRTAQGKHAERPHNLMRATMVLLQSLLGEFNKEQEAFIKEKQDKSSDAAVPPWVGCPNEESLKEECLTLSTVSRGPCAPCRGRDSSRGIGTCSGWLGPPLNVLPNEPPLTGRLSVMERTILWRSELAL
ncbi:hypothetical protein PR048_014910 [Dryococelus australis]|uniref:Uncharacterized protein n=1 Tax=Dryococelus australis TaxID=614101 RepID=A0ABQ9HFX1_9NEOP|nr:hypothetical protein PR048_014910 [Dryococelus australis]